MTDKLIKDIVIVGGGAAGWLTAARLAAEFNTGASGMSVTLVESPDIKNIGVGEGTWPSMRQSLQRIGISEQEFISCCEASFKQGSKFVDWKRGKGEYYYHPFTEPMAYQQINLARFWQPSAGKFDEVVSPQPIICDHNLAPKQLNTPDYAEVLTYGYHLNAGKFIDLLRHYAVDKYGVRHILAEVNSVQALDGDITSLQTDEAGEITGDFFIDCSGLHGLLIEQHYSIPWLSVKDCLFNDTALAMQVPYPDDNYPIQSATVATARPFGWIWDIGLSSRRGVGHVFSRDFATEEKVETSLRDYLVGHCGLDAATAEKIDYRMIKFEPGYRKTFWQGNCLAVGMAAGFIEPLEATALVLVELAADMICRELPRDRGTMDIVAKRYNNIFANHWEQIIGFLKLHYVLSERNEPYWLAHREPNSLPSNLRDQLLLWQSRAPYHVDATAAFEMFPSASYQYVLYGMGFPSAQSHIHHRNDAATAEQASMMFNKNVLKTKQLREHLPTNRFLVNNISQRNR